MFARLSLRGKTRRAVGAVPTPDDLLPELAGTYAEDAIAWLAAEHAADRLDYYRQLGTGNWLIWLPDRVVPGGVRLTLKEWTLVYLVSKLSTLPGWDCSIEVFNQPSPPAAAGNTSGNTGTYAREGAQHA